MMDVGKQFVFLETHFKPGRKYPKPTMCLMSILFSKFHRAVQINSSKYFLNKTISMMPWAPRRAIQRFGQCHVNELGSLGTWDTHEGGGRENLCSRGVLPIVNFWEVFGWFSTLVVDFSSENVDSSGFYRFCAL